MTPKQELPKDMLLTEASRVIRLGQQRDFFAVRALYDSKISADELKLYLEETESEILAQIAKCNKRLDNKELREKIACAICSNRGICKAKALTPIMGGRILSGVCSTHLQAADRVLALYPDIGEAFSDGYNMGAQDADTDNKETAEEIRKQERERIDKLISDYFKDNPWITEEDWQALKGG